MTPAHASLVLSQTHKASLTESSRTEANSNKYLVKANMVGGVHPPALAFVCMYFFLPIIYFMLLPRVLALSPNPGGAISVLHS